MRNKWILAFGLVLGCAPAAPAQAYRVCLSEAFTPAEMEAGLGAIDDWVWALDGGLRLDPQVGGLCGIESVGPTIDVAPSRMNEGSGGLTVYYRNYNREYALVSIDTWLEGRPGFVLQQVFAHEYGHGMGLHHTGAGTIMCWSTTCQSAGVTALDVAQWRSIR